MDIKAIICQCLYMYNARHAAPEALSLTHAERQVMTPEFIPQENMQHLVIAAMKGRVESTTGQLLPIEEERTLIGGPDYMMKPLPSVMRHDVVLPGEPQTFQHHGGGEIEVTHKYSVPGELYTSFINEHTINLSVADAERLQYDRTKFEESVNSRPDLKGMFSSEQAHDAYHIVQKDGPAPNSDGQLVSPARAYVPGGAQGVQIMHRLIEAGADFASAKIWVPQIARGEQSFRRDTPIVTANTVGQLRSIVGAVRAIANESLDKGQEVSPIGIPIESVPGVFVAQPSYRSFNSEMSRFWSKPIQAACNSLPLQAGDVVTQEWVNEAASRAAAIAQEQAVSAGINPQCHALLAEQDVTLVMDAINGQHR